MMYNEYSDFLNIEKGRLMETSWSGHKQEGGEEEARLSMLYKCWVT